MATPSHSLRAFYSFSLSPHNLFSFSLLSLRTQQHFHIFHLRSRRRLLPAICASLKKPRPSSRKVRSNADLCNDIIEFVSEVGLPDGHVPSVKELQQHGRQDLANIVRRRGYRLIKELLATSIKTNINDSGKEEGLTGNQDKASAREEESTEGQDENVIDLDEDVSSTSELPRREEHSSSMDSDSNSNDESCSVFEGSAKSSLQEKAERFIQHGELEIIEDNSFDVVKESVAEDDKRFSESHCPTEPELSSVSEEQSDQLLCRSDTGTILNGSRMSPSQWPVLSTSEKGTLRKDYSLNGQLVTADRDKDLDVETITKENQVEVNRIKFMLHQKELELSHLKQQIEKEKQSLSEMQTKAETEISKARKLVSDKDAELRAAEESLSGLKEVEIQYWGDGETVEVAGSFNGWHHPIKMDPQPSSQVTDTIGSRTSKLWRSLLWLYPGIYEIKFIVDGKWTIDPMKESVTRGTIHNNILQVDR